MKKSIILLPMLLSLVCNNIFAMEHKQPVTFKDRLKTAASTAVPAMLGITSLAGMGMLFAKKHPKIAWGMAVFSSLGLGYYYSSHAGKQRAQALKLVDELKDSNTINREKKADALKMCIDEVEHSSSLSIAFMLAGPAVSALGYVSTLFEQDK